MLTLADLQRRLDAIPAMMSAKGLAQPEAYAIINGNDKSWFSAAWREPSKFGSDRKSHICGDIDALEFWIAALPGPEVKALTDQQKGLANLIDNARANNLDDQWVAPLATVFEALSTNLLTHEPPDHLAGILAEARA